MNIGTVTKALDNLKSAILGKSTVESYNTGYYYAISGEDGSNVLLLGYSLDSNSDLIEEADNDMTDRYAIITHKNWSDYTVNLLDSGTDIKTAHSDALDLVENGRNNIMSAAICIGLNKTYANRPIFQAQKTYSYLGKEELFDNLIDLDRLEKSAEAQSIIFPTSKYTVVQARAWLKSHGKHAGKVDTTDNYHRFRQFDPGSCSTTPKTIAFGGSGIKAIICNRKSGTKKDDELELENPEKNPAGNPESFDHEIAIKSADFAKGLVFGIVYEPDVLDTHGDWTSKDEIEKAAHEFLPRAALNKDHETDLDSNKVKVVESYIKLCDCPINGTPVKKGAWILVAKVEDEELKASIVKGERTGFSLEGTAVKV